MSSEDEKPQNTIATSKLLKGLWKYAAPDRYYVYFALVLMFATLGFYLSKPFLLKWSIEGITGNNLQQLKSAALIFLAVIISEYLCRSAYSVVINIAMLKTINRLRYALFDHILKFKMAYFDKHPVGALITRTVSDTESLGESLSAGIATVFIDILTILGILLVMANINLELTPIIIFAAPIVVVIVRWFGMKLRNAYIRVRAILAKGFAIMAQGIAGVEVTQLFNYHQQNLAEFQEINEDFRKATILANIYDAALYAAIDAVAAIVTAGVLYWGFGVRFEIIHVSVIIVYIDLIERIFIPIRNLSSKFATIQRALASLQRIFSLFETEAFIQSGSQKIPEDKLKIEFSDVKFRYSENGPEVLKGISFEINPGQTLALVGATGSGKSTIGRLMTRAYDGYKGHITIGNIEIKDANIHDLRSKIAVIHQDVALFPGTIRENITLGNFKITEKDIEEAIRIARVDKILKDLSGGLDFIVKEGGNNLSAGQAQLIVFARAMAHKSPVVLMDEATSNIDSVTESWIQEALEEIFKKKTVVVVAHRLSTIAKADLILVMKNGNIVERGKHQELQQQQGYYAELIKSSLQNS